MCVDLMLCPFNFVQSEAYVLVAARFASLQILPVLLG